MQKLEYRLKVMQEEQVRKFVATQHKHPVNSVTNDDTKWREVMDETQPNNTIEEHLVEEFVEYMGVDKKDPKFKVYVDKITEMFKGMTRQPGELIDLNNCSFLEWAINYFGE